MSRHEQQKRREQFLDLLNAHLATYLAQAAPRVTKKALAERLQIERTTLYKWLDGTNTIPPDAFQRLCTIIGFTQDQRTALLQLYDRVILLELPAISTGETPPLPNQTPFDVFISYASEDRARVFQIAKQLEATGVRLWFDRTDISSGANFAEEIARGIRDCKVLLLMCSNASMRSRNVKQEIQLAWKHMRPYLPLLLEPISFPEQLEYFLEGRQWIEVLDLPPEEWLPQTMTALARSGVQCSDTQSAASSSSASGAARTLVSPTYLAAGLKGLRSVARLTDQIWPVPADRMSRHVRLPTRGLGAPQDNVAHDFRLGSRVGLVLDIEQEGHLLLLDEGPEEIIYCLCPSWFAPSTRVRPGCLHLPQEESPYSSFILSGRPGREHLLAIISNVPLGLDWRPPSPPTPARELSDDDIEALLAQLRGLDVHRWQALATYFDVIA